MAEFHFATKTQFQMSDFLGFKQPFKDPQRKRKNVTGEIKQNWNKLIRTKLV